MSKYIDECVKKYGGLRYQIQLTGYNERRIVVWLDNITDEHSIRCAHIAMREVEDYFARNNYYLNIIEHHAKQGMTFEVAKDIKQWDRVYNNIDKILKRAFNLDVNAPLVVRS